MLLIYQACNLFGKITQEGLERNMRTMKQQGGVDEGK